MRSFVGFVGSLERKNREKGKMSTVIHNREKRSGESGKQPTKPTKG
jgi:hypothetical protein